MNNICVRCGTTKSGEWFKCCPVHVTEQGIDALCELCIMNVHPVCDVEGEEHEKPYFRSEDFTICIIHKTEYSDLYPDCEFEWKLVG